MLSSISLGNPPSSSVHCWVFGVCALHAPATRRFRYGGHVEAASVATFGVARDNEEGLGSLGGVPLVSQCQRLALNDNLPAGIGFVRVRVLAVVNELDLHVLIPGSYVCTTQQREREMI